jgi:hypothetical protein
MGNMLDCQGMLSLCRFKKDMVVMQSGATRDNIEKATLKSNRSNLRSTMRMLEISELTGHWQCRQCQVSEQLKVIHRLQHVLYMVKYGQDSLEAENLSRVENCIPCLLHCNKRVIDKIVRMFFIRAQESALQKSKAEGVRRIISIQNNVNKYALGRPGNPGSFKIPYDEKEATISDIKVDGTVSPRMLAAIDDGLVQRSFGQHSEISEAEKKTLSAIFKMLHYIFETLSKREYFTDQEIDELQVEINSFSVKWVELTGHDGISNYIHMMITGQIIYYLRKWRNYYHYENEGWRGFITIELIGEAVLEEIAALQSLKEIPLVFGC